MRRQGTMSEKIGLAGNIDMPMRQASTSSAMSDDAVPTSDPGDVSQIPCGNLVLEGEENLIVMLRPPLCWLSACKLGNMLLDIWKTMWARQRRSTGHTQRSMRRF